MFNNFIFARRNNVAGMLETPGMTGFRMAEQLRFTS